MPDKPDIQLQPIVQTLTTEALKAELERRELEDAKHAAGGAQAADTIILTEAVSHAWFELNQGELILDQDDPAYGTTGHLTDHGRLAVDLWAQAVEQRPHLSITQAAQRVAESLSPILLDRDDELEARGYTILHYVDADELEAAGMASGRTEAEALEVFNRDACGNAGIFTERQGRVALLYSGTTFVVASHD